jgi:hypothetical protein
MSSNLISIKSFLGKYYPELHYSATQDKYSQSGLDTFFDQRFYIQNNKVQMIVDPTMEGLSVSVSGNEIQVSQTLYDHPNVTVSNSLEIKDNPNNPKGLYNPETFSTLAYLVCQNHTMFRITGEVDEPIYVKYKSEFESFYNSVVIFEIAQGISVEISEEIESSSALNAVTNYILHAAAQVDLTTFYNNTRSAMSFVYRNIITHINSSFRHTVLGKGSSNVIDENKILLSTGSKAEFKGIINSNAQKFHSILVVHPENQDYSVNVDYRDILYGPANVTFFPLLVGQESAVGSNIVVSNIRLEEIQKADITTSITNYVKDITDRTILERMAGAKRFYHNKAKFLTFP